MVPKGLVERFRPEFETATYYGIKLIDMTKDELMAALLNEATKRASETMEHQRQSDFLRALRAQA